MNNAFTHTQRRKLVRLFLLVVFLMACSLPNLDAPSTPPATAPQFTDHILVSLTEPQNGEAYPISAGLSVRGEAISDEAITRLELWADGSLYETYTAPEDGLGLLVHYWTWSPRTLGTHTLLVRAYADQDRAALSNVIHIQGVQDPGYNLIVIAQPGDTVVSLADRYHVSAFDIVNNNPALIGNAPLEAGTEIVIHISAPPTSSVPSTTATILMKFNQMTVDLHSDYSSLQAAPAAPTLSVAGQGCGATLTIGDISANEKGFNVYRLSPGALAFSKLATLPAHTGSESLSHQDENLYGLYHYYVAAYDDTGETPSNLISLNITDATCAGQAAMLESLASIPAGVEEYYLYVSINNGDWRRFPAGDFTYLKKSQALDFNQVAASLAPNPVGDISMRGEIWGLVKGTANLLGTFDKTFKGGPPPAQFEPAGFYLALTTKLEVRGIFDPSNAKYPWQVEKGMAYDSHVFRFGTDTNAAYGIWQVASVPFEPGAAFNPACLLLSGKANGSGTPQEPYQFSIDFAALKPQVESVSLSPFENTFDQTPVFFSPFSPEKFDASPQQAVNKPSWGAGALGLGGGAPVFVGYDPCTKNVSAEGVVTYYVRLIPMSNGQAAGQPSNTVTMTYDPDGQIKIKIPAPPPLPENVYYDVKILNFTGVHVPDFKYEYCVTVVKNASTLPGWSSLKPGDVICPEKDTGNDGFLGKLGDLVESAFNYISEAYDKLSDWATELVEQLNPLCIQAKMASSAIKVGEKEVKDACHYIAVAVVTAAKTYAGLPPSLPNFDQLTEMGKQNLVDLAAQELENNGVPCPEECKNVIRKGLDASIEHVQKSMSNSSCTSEVEEHGYKKLCLPPGIVTQPDPRSQPAPAVLEVQVTRRMLSTGPNFPAPTACNVFVNVYAKNDSHVGQQYSFNTGFNWAGAPIEGKLLDGTAAFPTLQPGQSTTFPIILAPASFWLAGHKQFIKQGWKPEHFDDWNLLYQGATATINAGGTCKFDLPEGTGFTDKVVNGASKQVGPLGDAWPNTCHPYNCP